MNKRIPYFAAALLLLAAAGNAFAQCKTASENGFYAYYRGGLGDLNDYGAIQLDSEDPNCVKRAHDVLITKLSSTPDGEFDEPLFGYKMALIFAAANRIGAMGWFNSAYNSANSPDTLRAQLDRIIPLYGVNPNAGECGFNGNSCMDDDAGAAAAYGWMAAYKKKRRDGDTWWFAATTHTYVNKFFDDICYFDQTEFNNEVATNGAASTVCNATVGDLGGLYLPGPAKIMSFEHGFQTPHYGLGLMTSIAQAITGVEAAGAGIALTDNQKIAARALFAEVQQHTDVNYAYTHDCLNPEGGPGAWTMGPNMDCQDFHDEFNRGYDPRMYHLSNFYDGHVGGRPYGYYQSDDTCCTDYPYWAVSNFNSEWGAGRFATYHDQGWTWYRDRNLPGRYMPFDDYEPIGYFDAVDGNGVAYGWACDPDAPDKWVKVDLYYNGSRIPIPNDATTTLATAPSEPAVNQLCGGGTAHRFFIQLPWGYQGLPIEVKARDFTFGPDVQLTCLESPNCAW